MPVRDSPGSCAIHGVRWDNVRVVVGALDVERQRS